MISNQPAFMVITWGCQMNEDDSSQMKNLLEQMGYRQASDESEADIILLNTCSVRAKPEQKVLSKLGELRLLREEKPGLIVGVCGCMAQREGKDLFRRGANMVIGTAAIYELPELIARVIRGERRVSALDLPERNGSRKEAHTPRTATEVGLKMFVPAMYGCNNFCAYCVVPQARGPERSRPADEIITEVTELASRGCREITLVGQNVNSYGQPSGDTDFAGLLSLLNDIPDLERIRFMTSHPKDLSDRLIEVFVALPKVCEHLHLPIQAGDNEVLRRMGRGYTVEHYLELVEKLRSRLPDISLTTDVMVGFPGETEEQFQNTLRVLEKIRYDAAFTFAFNARPGTVAALMENQIDSRTKARRLKQLIDMQNDITYEKNQAMVGNTFEVLIEGPSETNPLRFTGYNRMNKTVNFTGSSCFTGKLANVYAKKAHPWGFTGELVEG